MSEWSGDRRITFQHDEGSTGLMSDAGENWVDVATVWAERKDVSDGERAAAGQIGSFVMSRFVVRSTSTTKAITPVDRISHAGAFWNIKGIKETAEGRNRFLEFTAVRDTDG